MSRQPVDPEQVAALQRQLEALRGPLSKLQVKGARESQEILAEVAKLAGELAAAGTAPAGGEAKKQQLQQQAKKVQELLARLGASTRR